MSFFFVIVRIARILEARGGRREVQNPSRRVLRHKITEGGEVLCILGPGLGHLHDAPRVRQIVAREIRREYKQKSLFI